MAEFDPAHVVGTGGAVGALLRHWVGQQIDAEAFPAATFAVNVVGSFVLAVVTFGSFGGQLALLVGVGVCGSFTTYSSFSCETVRLYETGQRALAIANALGTLVVCLLVVGVVWLLA